MFKQLCKKIKNIFVTLIMPMWNVIKRFINGTFFGIALAIFSIVIGIFSCKNSASLKSIEWQTLLNSSVKKIDLRINHKNIRDMNDLDGLNLYFLLGKSKQFNIETYINVPPKKGQFYAVPIIPNIKDPNDIIIYDTWTKLNLNGAYERLNNGTSINNNYIESVMYIEPSSELSSLRIIDLHDSFLLVMLNTKALKIIKNIELKLNNKLIVSIDSKTWKINEAHFIDYPSIEYKLEYETIYPNQKWYLIGMKNKLNEIVSFRLNLLKDSRSSEILIPHEPRIKIKVK